MNKCFRRCSGRAAMMAFLLSPALSVQAQCDPHWEEPRNGPHGITGAFYDSVRHETVLVSGYPDGFAETWIWNGRKWRRHSGAGPTARSSSAVAFDAARGRGVLFGGTSSASSLLGDTWEWDGAAWTRVATSGPPARYRHALAYDAAGSRVILFGGARTGGMLSDTCEWDGGAWTQVVATGVSPRFDHAMFTDPV